MQIQILTTELTESEARTAFSGEQVKLARTVRPELLSGALFFRVGSPLPRVTPD